MLYLCSSGLIQNHPFWNQYISVKFSKPSETYISYWKDREVVEVSRSPTWDYLNILNVHFDEFHISKDFDNFDGQQYKMKIEYYLLLIRLRQDYKMANARIWESVDSEE